MVKDHTSSTRFYFSADGGSGIRLYRGNGALSITSATQLGAQTWDVITDMQVSSDGSTIVFTGAQTPTDPIEVWKIGSNGSGLARLDAGNEFSVSPVVGSTEIAFVKDNAAGTASELYTRSYTTTSATVSATQLTTFGQTVATPNFTKDGSKIVFSRLLPTTPAGDQYDLFSLTASGSGLTQLTNSSAISEIGGSFNEAMNRLSYISFDATNPTFLQVSDSGGANPNVLVTDSGLSFTTYWTSSIGRGTDGIGFRVSRPDLAKNRRR